MEADGFPAVRTPFFFLVIPAAGIEAAATAAPIGFPLRFLTTVPDDVLDAELLLLTDRASTEGISPTIPPRFGFFAADFAITDRLVALRPVLTFARVDLALSLVLFVVFSPTLIALALDGMATLMGGGFSGEVGYER